jgi:spore coat protein CotH
VDIPLLDPTTLFDNTRLPTFNITIPAKCWRSLQLDPDVYCEASLLYTPDEGSSESQTFERVGVRLKGRASAQPLTGKPSFKIKLDEFVSGLKQGSVRRLTLNNMIQDWSMMHEVLGYRYYRAAGVSAPRCNHARVIVNGKYYGLYANVETLDERFVRSAFGSTAGNLFDISNDVYFVDLQPWYKASFELETNKSAANTSDLDSLLQTVEDALEADTFYADVGKKLDWKAVLAAAASQAVLSDWDGFFGARNNFKLYHEVVRDKFILLPWGIDQTFGSYDGDSGNPLHHLEYQFDHSNSGRNPSVIIEACMAHDDCRADYREAVRAALTVFEELPLEAELDAALELTEQARLEDPHRYATYADLYTDALRTFIKDRPALVEWQLAPPPP